MSAKADTEESSPQHLAILFADVVDSSRLYATYGNAEARRIVSSCLETMSAVVTEQGGAVVKTIGDELMCRFPTADAAVTAAVVMQQRVQERTRQGQLHASLSLRVGLHEGPVVLEEADLFGDAVNLAARMASLSKAHQIMTTRHTVDALEGGLRPLARFVDQSTIKGQTGAFDLYEIVWDTTEATLATSQTARVSTQRIRVALEVTYGEQAWTVDVDHPVVTIGRSSQCDVVVEDTKASRLHAKIEYVKDRFVLKDVSTNGTHIRLEDSGTHLVRRDELIITSGGLISLGRPVDTESPLLIRVVLRKDVERL